MRSPVTGTTARGMVKGIVAAASAAESAAGRGAGTATLLEAAGSAWAAKAGGASGALWGAALAALGARLGDSTPTITAEDVVAALRNALEAIGTLGKSEPGDKTMLDALDPFISALAGHVSGGPTSPTRGRGRLRRPSRPPRRQLPSRPASGVLARSPNGASVHPTQGPSHSPCA